MPGPMPKQPGSRARTNRSSTATTLTANPSARVPKLPPHPGLEEGHDWHPQVTAMWKDVWKSPMAAEYDESDKHGMYVVALLYDDFYTATTPRLRAEIAAELRLSGQRFGFSPIDRRRLQWQIEQTEDAQDRGRRRRGATAKATQEPAPPVSKDPRAILRSIG